MRLAAVLAGAATAEPECPPTRPRVEVALDDPEPSLHHGLGMDALRAEGATPGGATHHHLGVTTFRVEWQSEIEARIVSASGRSCARPERVSLNIRHVEHSVRIAGELPRGGCLYRETEAHERRHVSVNRATLRRAASQAEAAVRRWAASAAGAATRSKRRRRRCGTACAKPWRPRWKRRKRRGTRPTAG